MKKIILSSLIVIIFLTSCSQYTVTGGGCGVWMPRKYSGKAPKVGRFVKMPVIN